VPRRAIAKDSGPVRAVLALPSDALVDIDAAAGAARLMVVNNGHIERKVTFFDTFDGRLYRAGLALWQRRLRTGTQVYLGGLDGAVIEQVRFRPSPGFIGALPDSSLRKKIVSIVGARRLLPLGRLNESVHQFTLCDELAKTLANVEIAQGHVVSADRSEPLGSAPQTITVAALRGYDKPTTRFLKAVLNRHADLRETGDYVGDALRAGGLDPLGHDNKPHVPMHGTDPIGVTAPAVFHAFLDSMLANEMGTRKNLDVEFLHEFRVAVRRTRSLLSVLSEIYDLDELTYFRAEFGWLGQLTGPARDLDVYLSKLPKYAAQLTEVDVAALAMLKDHLQRQQRAAYRRLAKGLADQRFADLKVRWISFLERPMGREDASSAAQLYSSQAWASATIGRRYRRVMKRGSAISDEMPAERLHDLRIQCKKLRYLLDGFRTLYNPYGVARLIKDLKRLQNNLGDFNDFEVQRGALREFAAQMGAKGTANTQVLMVMGGLVERAALGQARERARFETVWQQFSCAENRYFARDSFANVKRASR
jgi:CHAD domain-containing protein